MSSPHSSSLWAVVPAAGVGRRYGADLPKQYLPLLGETVLEHGLARLLALPELRRLVLVGAREARHGRGLPAGGAHRTGGGPGGAGRAAGGGWGSGGPPLAESAPLPGPTDPGGDRRQRAGGFGSGRGRGPGGAGR